MLTTSRTAGRTIVARRLLLAQHRNFSSHGGRGDRLVAPKYDDRQLWVSFADPATMRRRLVGVAQQVREQIDLAPEHLPDLRFPNEEKRIRQGFWFMRFMKEQARTSATQQLHDKEFESACGTLRGRLRCTPGKWHQDVCMHLTIPRSDPDPVVEWLRATFNPYGRLACVRTPRLQNNWDQGFGFVEFDAPEDADAAVQALDGTMGPIPGCRMYVDFATLSKGEPLAAMLPPPILPIRRRSPGPARAMIETQ
jgi:hypothetical protein